MPRVVISVRVSEQTARAIDQMRGATARARWVEDLIEEAVTPPMAATAPRFSGCDHPRARVIKGFCYKCGTMVLPR